MQVGELEKRLLVQYVLSSLIISNNVTFWYFEPTSLRDTWNESITCNMSTSIVAP